MCLVERNVSNEFNFLLSYFSFSFLINNVISLKSADERNLVHKKYTKVPTKRESRRARN
jgi:hypothetical protein